MVEFKLHHPRMTQAHLGLLPLMLSHGDKRPAKVQFNDNYKHGGGWRPFKGFVLSENNTITYGKGEDKEVYTPLATCQLGDELIVYYSHSWVAIIQPDRSFEACRMD